MHGVETSESLEAALDGPGVDDHVVFYMRSYFGATEVPARSTALMLVATAMMPEAAEMAMALISAGQPLHAQDCNGDSAFHLAVRNFRREARWPGEDVRARRQRAGETLHVIQGCGGESDLKNEAAETPYELLRAILPDAFGGVGREIDLLKRGEGQPPSV